MLHKSLAALVVAGFFAETALGGVTFFTDEAAFDQALVDAGQFFKGIEDFEQTGLNGNVFFSDPLHINNLPDFFPPGDFIDNLTFQSNTNGTNSVNDPGVNGLNPRGVFALRAHGPGGGQTANVGLAAAFGADSLDILSGPPAGGDHTALAMHVFTYAVGGAGPLPVEMRVFDKNEQLAGEPFTIMAGTGAGQFVGILATGGETIGRVNIWGTGGFVSVGILDIRTYGIPAPSALALLGVAGLMGGRRRRRK